MIQSPTCSTSVRFSLPSSTLVNHCAPITANKTPARAPSPALLSICLAAAPDVAAIDAGPDAADAAFDPDPAAEAPLVMLPPAPPAARAALPEVLLVMGNVSVTIKPGS